MRGLLITKNFETKILDGGQYINKRNKELLDACCNELDVIEIENLSYKNPLKKIKFMLKNKNFYGVSKENKKYIFEKISSKKYDLCFMSSSLIGCLVKDLKKTYPNLKVIVFFHNVEYIYYKQLAKQTGLYKLLLALFAKYNEILSVKWADNIISLNERDAQNILREYKRKIDLVIPTTFKDIYIYEKCKKEVYINSKVKKILFIGSDFYANFQGIEWFIKNVLPNLNNTVLNIIGKGTENWKQKIKKRDDLKIIGAVKDMRLYYQEADIIVLPIFLGSGMKTKTAEALMYGKYIFGTTEAFEGYDLEYDKVGGLCNNKEEFIFKINNHLKSINEKYNEYSRKIFLEKYCTDKYIEKMRKCLEGR